VKPRKTANPEHIGRSTRSVLFAKQTPLPCFARFAFRGVRADSAISRKTQHRPKTVHGRRSTQCPQAEKTLRGTNPSEPLPAAWSGTCGDGSTSAGLCRFRPHAPFVREADLYMFPHFAMEDVLTLRTEHLSAEIEWRREARCGALPSGFVSIHFDDGGTLTVCECCVPELLDLLTRAQCSIDERKANSSS